ncbi:hypothetical protein HYQ46_008140 [Verticillium longisporum]|nr:hypothetical protein HYQ46_008140 [Verticillium longisporum]
MTKRRNKNEKLGSTTTHPAEAVGILAPPARPGFRQRGPRGNSSEHACCCVLCAACLCFLALSLVFSLGDV